MLPGIDGFECIRQLRRDGEVPIVVVSARGDTHDVVAALVAEGVTIFTPVSEAPGGWSADFLDPDGFGLGLWQPGDKPRSMKK